MQLPYFEVATRSLAQWEKHSDTKYPLVCLRPVGIETVDLKPAGKDIADSPNVTGLVWALLLPCCFRTASKP